MGVWSKKKTLKYWWSKNIFLPKIVFFLSCSLTWPTVSEILARSGSGLQEFDRMDKCAHKTLTLNVTQIVVYIPGKFSFVRKSIMTVSSPNHSMCLCCHHLNHVICVWLVQTIASPEQINLSKNPTIGRVMNMIGGSRMNLHCIDLLIRHFGQATKRRQSVFLLYLCIMTHISPWFIFIWLRRQLILFLLPDANHIQMHLIRL